MCLVSRERRSHLGVVVTNLYELMKHIYDQSRRPARSMYEMRIIEIWHDQQRMPRAYYLARSGVVIGTLAFS
ncbi:hypothetical protein TRAPUB_9671 [Trametes pubescens]|uniref:Uncharacterized protein n=1 Tax=Trametes pubescens TaxID=154538 RepID=A0A1M2W1U3_TRAPU|nr:hypothetical protein TRAPUB_9671 [Trametes pubescens]